MVRLIGVLTLAEYADNSILSDSLYSPSPKHVIQELDSFPRGSRIGLAFPDPAGQSELSDYFSSIQAGIPEGKRKTYEGAMEYRDYWSHIVSHCEERGNDVKFLGAREPMKKYLEAIARLTREKISAFHVLNRLNDVIAPQEAIEVSELNDRLYRLDAEADYLIDVEVPRAVIRQAAESKLDVLIAHVNFADCWMSDGANIRKETGMPLEGYSTDLIYESDVQIRHSFKRNAEPDPKRVFRQERRKRAMKSIEQGRITDGRPDYIGTWAMHNPRFGLFEVYLYGGAEVKVIEDCLGTAGLDFFEGPGEINFRKNYVRRLSDIDVKNAEIIYVGYNGSAGAVLGQFASDGEPSYFIMVPADQAPSDPVDLVRRFFRESLLSA